ncbi:hypothetical protein [Mammaliicoccus vitulinus]|nr:hypothetical protein [Mammaliicoccus vitulinus]
MSEFIAALVGGILALIGTFSAVWLQFKNKIKIKNESIIMI